MSRVIATISSDFTNTTPDQGGPEASWPGRRWPRLALEGVGAGAGGRAWERVGARARGQAWERVCGQAGRQARVWASVGAGRRGWVRAGAGRRGWVRVVCRGWCDSNKVSRYSGMDGGGVWLMDVW